jgi:putative peptidoglycan lipid II flippase
MLGLFSRGAFNADAAAAAASVLSVYAIGLPAFILIRTVTPLFHSRGDTSTPVRATLISIAVNLSVKVGLIWGLGWGAEGLAAGTVVGAFVNLGLLLVLAQGQGLLSIGRRLRVRSGYVALATAGMAVAVFAAQGPVLEAVTALSRFQHEAALVILGGFSLIVYGLGVWGFGLLQRR